MSQVPIAAIRLLDLAQLVLHEAFKVRELGNGQHSVKMRGGNWKQYIVDWVIAGHIGKPDPAVDFVQ